MAYFPSGRSNDELVKQLTTNGLIKSKRVAEAFRGVDRKNYVLDQRQAYMDMPLPIICNATISAPHMHASAIESLLPFLKPGARVLDIGSGSGYLCAVLHHIVSPPSGSQDGSGQVVGIDHISELVEWSVNNLRQDGLGQAIDQGHIKMVHGDGRKGWMADSPYDAIHVGAAAPTLPKEILDQLNSPGRLFIPVGTAEQAIIQVDKDEMGNITEKKLLDVRYVPLTSKDVLEAYEMIALCIF